MWISYTTLCTRKIILFSFSFIIVHTFKWIKVYIEHKQQNHSRKQKVSKWNIFTASPLLFAAEVTCSENVPTIRRSRNKRRPHHSSNVGTLQRFLWQLKCDIFRARQLRLCSAINSSSRVMSKCSLTLLLRKSLKKFPSTIFCLAGTNDVHLRVDMLVWCGVFFFTEYVKTIKANVTQ